jgi:tetratricopeptide (TPR) repeat protein
VASLTIRLTLVLVLLFVPAAIATADPAELIRNGRAACAREDHEEAIALYRRAIVEDPSVYDSIGISLASQLTWAGRYDEAIREFKRFVGDHLVDTEALLTLALAQFWADRLDDALRTYRCVLHQEPENLEAAFGEARMLTWQGKLDGSLDKYEKLLARKPDFREAALHRAMVVNWIGDHRRSADLYSAILESEPEAVDALSGRAQAWSAAGLGDRALVDLEETVRLKPNDAQATRLLERIRRSWSPGVRSRIEFLRDSDDFQRIGTRVEAEIPFAFRVRSALLAERNDYSKTGRPTTEDLWIGIAGEARISEDLLIYGSSKALAIAPTGVEGTRGIGHGHLAWLPNDRVRVDLGYTREALFTYERSPDFTVRYLDGDILDVGLTARPYWRTRVALGVDHGSFADGNDRTNARIRLRHDLLLQPRVRIEAGFHHLDYEDDRGGGVWTPQGFRSFLLAGEFEWTLHDDLRLLGRLESGTAGDRHSEDRAHLTALGGCRYQKGGLEFELRVGRADADLETGRGYRRSFADLTAGFRL